MKKLRGSSVNGNAEKKNPPNSSVKEVEPEGGGGAKHILAETTYEPVGARAVLYQSVSAYLFITAVRFPVRRAGGGRLFTEKETNAEADTCTDNG